MTSAAPAPVLQTAHTEADDRALARIRCLHGRRDILAAVCHRGGRADGLQVRCAGFLVRGVADLRAAASDPHQRHVLWLGQLGLGRARLLRRRAQLAHAACTAPSSPGSGSCCSTWLRWPARSLSISGYNDGNLEYREWPWPIRLIFLAALARHRLESDRHRRATPHRRHLSLQLVHHRRRAVDLHHRCGRDPAVVSVRPRPGVGVRLLHAQRGRHVVYAAGARGSSTTRCPSCSAGRSIPTRSASSPSGPISCSIRSSARIISSSARCRGGCRPPPSCSASRCWCRFGAAAPTSC